MILCDVKVCHSYTDLMRPSHDILAWLLWFVSLVITSDYTQNTGVEWLENKRYQEYLMTVFLTRQGKQEQGSRIKPLPTRTTYDRISSSHDSLGTLQTRTTIYTTFVPSQYINQDHNCTFLYTLNRPGTQPEKNGSQEYFFCFEFLGFCFVLLTLEESVYYEEVEWGKERTKSNQGDQLPKIWDFI